MSGRQLWWFALSLGFALGSALLFSPGPGLGQVAQTPVDGVELFDTQVRPVLERRCFACHSNPERAKSELLLTSRAELLSGGTRGPAIDPGEPGDSLLLHALSYADEQLEMPPSGQLPDEEIEVIRQWVLLGAPYGGDEDELTTVASTDEFTITAEDREWWSVLPLRRPSLPSVRDSAWPANGLDHFILARLEAEGLAPSPRADRRTLIRRATYDLTGLAPTLEDVAAFENDRRPDAWQRLVDRLLASPHYGEKWGRHWLDLVRFAETDGYERDRRKPGAWRYRDWVIDALNADMPYDQFLVHQLAGDEIESPDAASIIATGYLRLGIWDDEPTDTALAQYDDLDSVLDTTARVMLGASMGCARCHNHRGDPLPQRDYYRMLAYFRGLAPYKVGGGNAPTPEHYTDRIPADFGQPGAGSAVAEWLVERESRVAEIRGIVSSVETVTEPRKNVRSKDTMSRLLDQAARARTRGLVAHLSFEEDQPLVAVDRVGRFHGRVEDASVGAAGFEGSAYQFDGEDDSVRIERPIQDDFTISVWFQTEATAPGGVDLRWYRGSALVSGNAEGDLSDFGLSVVGEGYVVAGTGSPYTFLASGPGYNDGAWHLASLTRDQSSGLLKLYVDGEPVAEAAGPAGALDGPEIVDIGRHTHGRGHFTGRLDEVRFYERTLSPREVLDLYLFRDHLASGTFPSPDNAPAPDSKPVAEHRPGDARRVQQLLGQLLTDRRPEREYVEVLRAKELGPEAPSTHVLIRGNPHAPAQPVEPGFPEILLTSDTEAPSLPQPIASETSSGRRLALARWITSDDNLRTSRVMANRLWQFHFGHGIVPTPNDFGRFGQGPSHPLLLDWLASELTARDWSLKAMHRLIMTSASYQMASEGRAEALEVDPENTLLWRYDMRRLTAEEIRDSILSANGTLNPELGGPSVYPPLPAEVLATASRPDEAWGESTPEQATRRSVYIHVKRSLRHPLLDTMDLADTDATCPVRFVTTQPTQALTFLNSDFMNQQARWLADRVQRETSGSPGHGIEERDGIEERGGIEDNRVEQRVSRALELVVSREPSVSEIEQGVALIRELQEHDGFTAEDAFASYCLVLLNLNEFVYLD